jgi:hypothetical protein
VVPSLVSSDETSQLLTLYCLCGCPGTSLFVLQAASNVEFIKVVDFFEDDPDDPVSKEILEWWNL